MTVLMDVDGLVEALMRGEPPVVLDVRWALGDPHGREHYARGHIPGAVYVDLETELSAPPSPEAGRHPLPDTDDLQAAARRWGLGEGRSVVVYDAVGGTSAARAWWLLRWAGVPDVLLLDGGLQAWAASGRPVDTGEVTHEPGDITLIAGQLPTVDTDGAARTVAGGVLLDARAAERYRGEVEPVDPVPGHIPGAVSAPTTENLAEDGRFRPAAELRERFAELGVTEGTSATVYCGSGVTAAHEIAALAVAGIEAALYPGSWSQWSNDPSRPVAR